jgi:2-amino-4-hydroxy-6-hydroxymethyldihydropteridine diphosphokinase
MAPKGSDDGRALTDNPDMTRSFVGLGANLEAPRTQIERALELLGEEDGVEVVAVSTLRWTDPVGYEDQPRFLNGAAQLRTTLGARELLERLLSIERRLGRVRGESPRFGPRTIDLDLLLHGDEVIDEPGLQIPHPRLQERRFALEPLAELDPALELPGLGPVQTLLAGL